MSAERAVVVRVDVASHGSAGRWRSVGGMVVVTAAWIEKNRLIRTVDYVILFHKVERKRDIMKKLKKKLKKKVRKKK